jgi:hypothetical protein
MKKKNTNARVDINPKFRQHPFSISQNITYRRWSNTTSFTQIEFVNLYKQGTIIHHWNSKYTTSWTLGLLPEMYDTTVELQGLHNPHSIIIRHIRLIGCFILFFFSVIANYIVSLSHSQASIILTRDWRNERHRTQTVLAPSRHSTTQARSQNCEKRQLASCPSVRPHGTTQLPMDGF